MALKVVKGIMQQVAEGRVRFSKLPKEQCLTEGTLVKLERRVAASSRKNEAMLSESIRLARESKPVEQVKTKK